MNPLVAASAGNIVVWIVWVGAAFACLASGVAVISFSNPFYSALALIGNLASLAVLPVLPQPRLTQRQWRGVPRVAQMICGRAGTRFLVVNVFHAISLSCFVSLSWSNLRSLMRTASARQSGQVWRCSYT